jgi:tryptophan halogenase
MIGQHIEPQAYHPVVDQLTDDQLNGFLSGIRDYIARATAKLPDHRTFLDQHCPAIAGT